ncbi:mitogen-activated protein kinase kinase kinase 7-like [Chelonus insularis]|uniref:mitogen-activated protein kinase kinase kinase 7-like n=1 Tax=Chelonus insularis TaxID=460826 RepID=UPI00158BAD8D|nr:mitogen-activated protein kinase kinase kinase 7-like [Chelonus insularis]
MCAMSKGNLKEYKHHLVENKSKRQQEDQIVQTQQQHFDNSSQPPVLSPISSPSSSSSSSSSLSTASSPPPPRPLPRQKSLQQQFVEEIDYNEIETEEVVGKGSFGVVWKGVWRGRYVAIKHINTEGERRAFAVEVRQLSRVSHPNIVRLYGACTKDPVCLVMEYAEGGSLYNVLHCEPKPRYTAGHAISWALQCARGVAYLHNMKPKPLIHRDLKPPNLLLVLGGRTLKICDFGTACDLNSYMTNNKGSAAWMAPEVFEGSRYTEKCDVFSWGVILWEVLARRKPFDDIGGSAYRIMWAVHVGQRPPLIEGCPKPIEDLIKRCWEKNPEKRPAMDEIVEIMDILSEFFTGDLEPVEYTPSEEFPDNEGSNENTIDVTWNSSQINGDFSANGLDSQSQVDYQTQTYNQEQLDRFKRPDSLQIAQGSNSAMSKQYSNASRNRVKDECDESNKRRIDTSKINLPPTPAVRNNKVNDSSNNFQPLHIDCDPNAWDHATSSDSSWELQNNPGLDKMGPKNKKIDRSSNNDNLDDVYRLLDADLRPLTPDNTCQLSINIFEEHKALAEEYLKVQTEIALVSQYKNDMLKSLSADSIRQQEELRKLEDEKESLIKLYRNLKRQLEIMKGQRRPGTSSTTNPLVSDDGWVCVPRQEPSRIS